ncbi:MAG: LytTR family DNA-binding domain-containing protein [Bacteroidota bacterium]
MNITAIIVDDENKARRVLRALIEEIAPTVEILAEANSLLSAIAAIKAQKPNIVFLDIEMPKYSGLEILNFFENDRVDFQIIFTTAYNQYAIEAFENNAIDYLLKPINEEKLKLAINKAAKNIEIHDLSSRLGKLENLYNKLSINKIALEVPRGVLFVALDDIIMLEADGSYTKVYLKDGKNQLISKNLKYFSDQLAQKIIFYKPHRSYIVNLKYLSKLEKKDNYYIVLENKKTIPIARDKKDEFLQIIQTIF